MNLHQTIVATFLFLYHLFKRTLTNNRTMKKIAAIFTCIWMLAVSGISAQIPFVFGVKSGVSLSNTTTDDYDMKVGFTAGLMVDYNFTRNVFVRSGLDFTMKGARLDVYKDGIASGTPVGYNYIEKVRTNYLQIPLMIGYKHRIADDTEVYAAGGVYAAYGVYGKGRYKAEPANNSNEVLYSEDSKYDSFDDMYLKKFDFGLSGSIGVIYDNYFINIGYEYGLANLQKDLPNLLISEYNPDQNRDLWVYRESKWRNLTATCTLGYRF